jgi:NAD(P)-dependent dehydrogenase (short-subunit alcohol dehydrogenase family)/acyl carrier protein
LTLRADASYLVVGGLSGLGLETARWLAGKGARTLLLMGRGGTRSDERRQAALELASRGVAVHVLETDVADRAALEGALAPCGRTLPPLKGVVHAAVVLDDATVENLTGERIETVLRPKIVGARNLHEVSREHALDFFVMYSSATTVFGNPGQASYVAANAYLEALAALRRQEGLPGLAVAWGAISDVGILARNAKVRDHLVSRIGDGGLSSGEALAILEELMVSGKVTSAVTRIDWGKLLKALPGAGAPKYSAIREQPPGDACETETGQKFVARISGVSPEERFEAVVALLKSRIGQVMQWPLDRIDVNKPVVEMGLDSLMGVELHRALEKDLEMPIPRTLVGAGTTIVELATTIDRRLDAKARPG